MTTTTAPSVDQNLEAAVTAVREEIGRTDSKASLLLAFDGAGLAGLASVADAQLPAAAMVLGGLSATGLALAAALLLLVVRPHLTGLDGTPAAGTFTHWAALDDDAAILAAMSDDHRVTRVRALSALAVRKYRRLRWAVDVSLGSLALLAIAAAAAL